jgi:hypothetical protein
MFSKIPREIQNLIFDYFKVKCNICNIYIYKYKLYKILNNKYYCSKLCYEFI